MAPNTRLVLIGAGIGLVIVSAMSKTAGKVVNAVNPLNQDNVINQGVTGLYQWATGSEGTIGGDIYDVTHNGTFNPTSDNNLIYKAHHELYQFVTGSEGTLGGDIYDITHDGTLNPASENNIINRGVNKVGEAVTGNKNWTLGGQIYDWIHGT